MAGSLEGTARDRPPMGGGASRYQGVHHILAPEAIRSPAISFTVL